MDWEANDIERIRGCRKGEGEGINQGGGLWRYRKHAGKIRIVSRDLFLVANKHPKTSHRIFCPVQFSNEFFRTGQKIPDFSSD